MTFTMFIPCIVAKYLMKRQYKPYSVIYAYSILHSYVKIVDINYRIVLLLVLHELHT